jgi:hypothetical protein
MMPMENVELREKVERNTREVQGRDAGRGLVAQHRPWRLDMSANGIHPLEALRDNYRSFRSLPEDLSAVGGCSISVAGMDSTASRPRRPRASVVLRRLLAPGASLHSAWEAPGFEGRIPRDERL